MSFEEKRRRELVAMNSQKLKNFKRLQKMAINNENILISCGRLSPSSFYYNKEKKYYCFTIDVKDINISFNINEDKVKNDKTLSEIVAAVKKGKSLFLDIKGNIISEYETDSFIPTSIEIVTKKVFNTLGIMSDKEIDKKIEEEIKQKEKQKAKAKTDISTTYRTRIPDQNDPEYIVLNPNPNNKGIGFLEFDDPENPQKEILYLSFSEYGRGLEFLEDIVSLDTFQVMANTQYLNFIHYCSNFIPELPSDVETLLDLSQEKIYDYINFVKKNNPDLLKKFHKDTENDVHVRLEMDNTSNNAKVNLRIGDTWTPSFKIHFVQESPSMSM